MLPFVSWVIVAHSGMTSTPEFDVDIENLLKIEMDTAWAFLSSRPYSMEALNEDQSRFGDIHYVNQLLGRFLHSDQSISGWT
jgi:hypothetical protein